MGLLTMLEWLDPTDDNWKAGVTLLTIGLASFTIWHYGPLAWRLRNEDSDSKWILFGICWLAAGVIVNRLFWLSYMMAKISASFAVAFWMINNASYILLPVGLMLWFGYILHLYPKFYGRWRHKWWIGMAAFSLVIFAIGFMLPEAVEFDPTQWNYETTPD